MYNVKRHVKICVEYISKDIAENLNEYTVHQLYHCYNITRIII